MKPITKPIRLKVRDGTGDVIDRMIIDNRGAGIDIRQEDAPFMDADSSQPVDLEVLHCNACTTSIAEQIGLTAEEVSVIARWRHRKEDGTSAKRLGEILDKIVNRLDYTDNECTAESERFVIEVEETHG